VTQGSGMHGGNRVHVGLAVSGWVPGIGSIAG
jgi:hypothetical protein